MSLQLTDENKTDLMSALKKVNMISKELYKQKPQAYFKFIRHGKAYYEASLDLPIDYLSTANNSITVQFEIPIDDMGDAAFTNIMDGQLLRRWISN